MERYTVIGFEGKYLLVTCDVCSLDTELYPSGIFKTTKSCLKRCRKPCGCSKTPRFDRRQMEIVARRRVEARGWEFLGFKGEYHGVKTLLIMKSGDDISDTVTLNNLPKIKGFPTSRYVRTSESNRKPYAKVLKEIEQVLCEKEGTLTYFEEEDYKNNQSRVKYLCKRGHLCDVPVAVILRGSWCNRCSYIEQDWGHYSNRKNDTDNLYLIRLTDSKSSFLKLGRAFDLSVRFKAIENEGFSIEVLKTWSQTHSNIFNTEKAVGTEMRESLKWWPRKFTGWSECFKLSAMKEIITYVDCTINKTTKKEP